MKSALNATHDPALRSWVASANLPDCDFPIQNLPFGVFRPLGSGETFRGGVAIGDRIVDLAAASRAAFGGELAASALAQAAQSSLNAFMALGPRAWSAVRHALSEGLRSGSEAAAILGPCLLPQAEAEFSVPALIGDYTDFYTSIHHASAVGRFFRPDNPLLPNYRWMPIGYHGRSSSIGISGLAFRRPTGQTMPPDADRPTLVPSRRLDCELELGLYVGAGNALGTPVPMKDAESHIFGICLLNDWSARDLQAWESQPLGPFLSKNFATTLSPWIVTLEALAPFRTASRRPAGDPPPLPYLDSPENRAAGAMDIQMELGIQTSAMRRQGVPAQRLSKTSYRHAYWTPAQMISHHTITGCNLRPGDLLGTGTQSGPSPGEAGSLLELTAGGSVRIKVGDEFRTFLEDGDVVVMRAWCEAGGARRIGFGEVRAEVLPAVVAEPVL